MTQQQVLRIVLLLLPLAFSTFTEGLRAYPLWTPQRQTRLQEKAHRHIGTGKSTGVDIPEFSMVEATLEPTAKKESLITNRNRKYDAFTVSGTRLFVAERRTQKIFEVSGLPLEWRPFSDLYWANDETLMFDRWSQPHYGVHYAVNIRSRKLVVAVPFGDKFYRNQQRPKRQHNRKR